LNTKLPNERNFASVDLQLHPRHIPKSGSLEDPGEHGQPALTVQEVAAILSLEALQAIHDVISHLQRLSIAIRRASAREYNVEAAWERDKKDGHNDGSDDERCMRELVKYRFPNASEMRKSKTAKNSSAPKPADRPAEVKKEDPVVDDVELQKLREFLMTAMSFRVRRFKHRRHQHDKNVKIQIRKAAVQQTVSRVNTQPTPSQIEQNVSVDNKRDHGGLSKRIGVSGPSNQGSERPSFNSTLFEPPRSTVSSRISTGSTRSVAGDIQFHWPGRPNPGDPDPGGRVVYECPYCFDHLEVEEAQDKKRWRSANTSTFLLIRMGINIVFEGSMSNVTWSRIIASFQGQSVRHI
jgi:hypothetical protein